MSSLYPYVQEGPVAGDALRSMPGFPSNTPLGALAGFVPTEGNPFFSMKIGEKTIMGAMPGALLEQVTFDPRKIEDKKAAEYDGRLREIAQVRADVQRLFEGVKKKNVPLYADYIRKVARGDRLGITPPIILWTPQPLKVIEVGMGLVITVLPFGVLLVAIDGETQLASRYKAWEDDPSVKEQPVPVMVVHGQPTEWARQGFHDLNVYGSKPNAAIAISMDAYDPATEIARELELEVDFLKGRVNKVRRQLRRTDRASGETMTITALRGSIVTLARGIGGVAVGAKSVDIAETDRARVRAAAVAWWDALGEHLGDQIEDPDSVASAPAAIAALGAVGHKLVERFEELDRAGMLEEHADTLARDLAEEVDWEKGDPWAGIAGKYTPAGRFSIGGAKETSYLIYDALTDADSSGYRKIRR